MKPLMKLLVIVVTAMAFCQTGLADKQIRMYLDYARFRYDDTQTYLEIYYSLYDQRINPVSTNVLLDFTLENTAKDTTLASDRISVALAGNGSQNGVRGSLIKTVLPPGEYRIKMVRVDELSSVKMDSMEYNFTATPFKGERIKVSDLELCSNIRTGSTQKGGLFYKNTMEVYPNPTRIYGMDNPQLFYYVEVYNIQQKLAASDEMLEIHAAIKDNKGTTLQQKKYRKSCEFESLVEIGRFNISKLKNGLYSLMFAVVAPDSEYSSINISNFYVVNQKEPAVAGADLMPERDAELALQIADYWNSRLEEWTLAVDTRLARRHGVSAYYVREAPADSLIDPKALARALPIKNRRDNVDWPADEQVALDFLQLVRLGLRRAEDPWIRDSVRVADALLRSDTPSGPVWHRYTYDGYGEHADGSPFDGAGIGRGWPLLTCERGHFALSAGEDPMPYLQAASKMTGGQGMLPEQVWDTDALPDRGLHPGRPNGAAMPLVWAHSEFVKLVASRTLGRPFDRPDSVWERYQGTRPQADTWIWTPGAPTRTVPNGKHLLLLFDRPVSLHWGSDGWTGVRDQSSRLLGLGLHAVHLPSGHLRTRHSLEFTWRWKDGARWYGEDFRMEITAE